MRWALGFLFLAAFTGGYLMATPRGIRNNNPGNIRKGADWLGMSPLQLDPSFVQFEYPVYGIRALARVLKTYFNKHKLTTIRAMVSRWAPPNENDTESYIRSVEKRVGIPAEEVMGVVSFEANLPALVEAIIHHENGQQPYTVAQIKQGILLS